MRLRYLLPFLIMELVIGCKRENQINYAPIPITPVPALLVRDVAEPNFPWPNCDFDYGAGESQLLIDSF